MEPFFGFVRAGVAAGAVEPRAADLPRAAVWASGYRVEPRGCVLPSVDITGFCGHHWRLHWRLGGSVHWAVGCRSGDRRNQAEIRP